jgi:hypothetical protein
MRKIDKIIGLVVIVLAICFGAAYIFLTVSGKAILIKKIEELTGKKTTIGYFGFTPTFHLEIRSLNVENLFKTDAIYITPDVIGLLTGKIRFNNLKFIRPEVTFIRTPPEVVEGVDANGHLIMVEPPPPAVPAAATAPAKSKSIPLAFKHFKIKDGKLIFIDQSMTSKSIKIVIKDLNCSITNLYLYPRPVTTNFSINGKIPWREGESEGQVELSGWINNAKKDMQATLKIRDIDAIYLYPYYATWVDLDKARIEKAKLNFSGDVVGVNNDVVVNCYMELVDMVRTPLEEGQREEKASLITNRVLEMLKAADEGKVELKFSIKTKMDNPQFGFENFKTAFEGKLFSVRKAQGFKIEDALAVPVRLVQNGAKSFSDLGKATVDGIFAIGSEIGKIGKDSFSKEVESEK